MTTTLEKVDLLTAGFPCQGLSVAGKGKGLEDERSGLFWEIIRIARRLRTPWLLLENVPGIRTSPRGANGRDFAVVLAALDELGYGVAWASLDAQWSGLAQRRKRVFIVCRLGAPCPPEILFEPEGMSGDSPPSREKGEGTSRDVASCLKGSGSGTERTGDTRGQDNVVAPPLTGNPHADNVSREGALVAFGGNKTSGPIDRATACNAHGGQGRMDFESETLLVAHTLRSEGHDGSGYGTGGGTPIVTAYRTGGNCGPFEQGDKTAALNTGTDRNQNIICVDPTQMTSKGNYSNPKSGDPCHPLASKGHAPLVTGSLSASGAGTERAAGQENQSDFCIPTGYGVRRLTPRECERLQGFPDDWTQVPYQGKPMSDSPRYRMLGNAVAMPVVQWILRRLKAAGVETVGELFAGIGGFGIAAEREALRVLWASEIDAQAQAVYAVRFPDVPLLGDVRLCG